MVLPASAPDAAPPAGAWLNRLSLILRLSGRGVLVLVDRARPEKLGELARHVLREHPDAEVLTEAQGLASLPDGSTAILCVRAIDADWLNQERPVVQARALRLILFSDEETTVHLARFAVDFYDWISHRIDCPEGPPSFAVRALRRAACARAPAIAWEGGDLDGTFAQALPTRILRRVSAAQPYAALVESLKPHPKEWVAVGDLDISLRSRRTSWAAAEANRRGRLILVQSVTEPPAKARAHARALSIKEGERRLREAGVERPARLSAILELEPDAVDAAARLSRAGMPEAELSEAALQSDDPGAALALFLEERGLRSATSERPGGERDEPEAQPRLRLPGWPKRIQMALEFDDVEVAIHWTAVFQASTGDDTTSSAVLAGLLAANGRFVEARAILKDVKRRIDKNTTDEARFEVMRAEGMTLLFERRTAEAVRALSEALEAARRLGASLRQCNELYLYLVSALIAERRLKDAERVLGEWSALWQHAHDREPFDTFWALVSAKLLLAKGDARAASDVLEPVLERRTALDHTSRGMLEETLAEALIQQRRSHEAKRLLREAIKRYERLGLTNTPLRHKHGRALYALGRFREAEQDLRQVLQELPESASRAGARIDLARCLAAQGRFPEAEELIDKVLPEMQGDLAARGADYAIALHEKARVRRLQGDVAAATELLQKVLRLQERAYDREHPTLLLTLVELGAALIEMRKPREAEPLLRRAVRLAEKVRDRPALTEALGDLARAQAAQGFAHARDPARRALYMWDAAEVEPPPALRRELEAIAAGSSAPSRRP